VPDLPKASTKYGCAGTVSSIRRRLTASRASAEPACGAGAEPAPRRNTTGDLLVLDAEDPDAEQFGGKSNIPANISQSDCSSS